MERRHFLTVASGVAAGFSVLTSGAAIAQAVSPRAGTDYLRLDRVAPVDAAAGKIELIEFFWYGCPHCSAFEPVLAQWVKTLPNDVLFRRVPIAFDSSFVPQQQLFYALEAMGLVDRVHAQVFAAIHRDKLKLTSAAQISAWVARQGVDAMAFANHFNSFTTATKARRATQLMAAYNVEGVPAIGVAGRFYTDGELTRNMDRALQVAAFLVDEVRAGR